MYGTYYELHSIIYGIYDDVNKKGNFLIKNITRIYKLRKYFKKQTYCTPAKYILEQKLHHARACLEQTDMYVYEVMEKVGATNPATFSKQFKARYSYSPNEYRKRFNKKY